MDVKIVVIHMGFMPIAELGSERPSACWPAQQAPSAVEQEPRAAKHGLMMKVIQ